MTLDPNDRGDETIQRWWSSLSTQDQIIWALKGAGYTSVGLQFNDESPLYVAEKPWKYMTEAYRLYQQAQAVKD